MKETKPVGTFAAHDADLNEYRVFVFQDFIVSCTRGGTSRMPRLKSMRIEDGQAVNYIDQGNYEIVGAFGTIPITSDDSNAP